MEPESLTHLMTEEHTRLSNMLEEISLMTKDNPDKILQSFNVFKWNIEKHFFIEEKAIFHIPGLSGSEVNDAFKLLQDHGVIIGLIKKVESDLSHRDFSSLPRLLEILDEHSQLENTVFYPNLDKKLSDDRKKEILERVNDILRG